VSTSVCEGRKEVSLFAAHEGILMSHGHPRLHARRAVHLESRYGLPQYDAGIPQ